MLKPSTGLLSQVMNLYPLTLNAQTPVTDAIAQMSQTQASCALIEKDGRLVGLFGERDVVRAVAAGKVRADIALITVMNRHVITLNESEAQNLITVVSTLQQHQICHLPILKSRGAEEGEGLGETCFTLQPDRDFSCSSPRQNNTSSPPLLRQVVGLISLTDLLQVLSNTDRDGNSGSSQSCYPSPLLSRLLDINEREQTQEILRQRGQEFRALAENSPDITERQLAQKVLEAQKDFLQSVLDTNPNLIFVKDRQGRYVLVNQAFANFYGRPVADFLGKTVAEINPNQADVEQFIAQDREILITLQQKFIPEAALYTLTGERCWYQIIKKPLFSSDGQVSQILGVCTDITGHKQAEEQRRESEERLHLALEAARMGFWNWNLQTGTITWSNYLERLYGLAPNTYNETYERFLAIVHPEDRTLIDQAKRRFLETGECDREIEFRAVCPDGKILWIESKLQVFYDEMGKPIRMIGLDIDITERKQAQLALVTQKDFLQTVLDTNPNLIFVKDQEGKFLLINQAFAQALGITVEAVVGLTDADLNLNRGDAERFIAQDREVFATLRQLVVPEEVCQLGTGERRWVQLIKTPIFSTDGQVHQLLGVATDITENKRIEEKLRQSEAQIRLALDAARMGFWNCDLLTAKTTWSNSLEHLYGFAPNSYDGTYETFLARIHPEDRDRFEQANQRSLETGEDCNIEFRIVLPDGTVRWIESKGQVFYDETGKPVRMTGINVDISDRKQAETQIKESLQEKEILLQEIHHRVKNNLQVISSLLDLQSQHLQEPALLEMFRESRNRVKSMALVHETLYQSQRFTQINCVEYIEGLTCDLFHAYGMNSDNITLELDIDDIALNVEQAIPCGLIINELVSNALKYAFPTNTKGTIYVALKCEFDITLKLIVKDTGIGLPKNLDFKTVPSLGLQLVNVLTSQLEGTIELDCRAGTEFIIYFPQP